MATFWILFSGVCRTARAVSYGNSKRNAYNRQQQRHARARANEKRTKEEQKSPFNFCKLQNSCSRNSELATLQMACHIYDGLYYCRRFASRQNTILFSSAGFLAAIQTGVFERLYALHYTLSQRIDATAINQQKWAKINSSPPIHSRWKMVFGGTC